MPDNFAVTSTTVPADVATSGTMEFPFPAGVAAADLEGGDPAQVVLILNDSDRYQGEEYVTVAYGTGITATNVHEGVTWRAGQAAMLQVPRKPAFVDAADAVDQMAAVIGAGSAIAPLDAAADLPTTIGTVNQLVAAFKAT